MQVSTKALVISKIRYKDSDLIVKCYTAKFGIKSYLIKNVLKSRKGKFKPAYFQPLTMVHIEAEHKQNRSLNFLKDVKIQNKFDSIHTNIIKSTMAMFLAEVLSIVLREEEENIPLFNFLEAAFIWFNEHKLDTNYHYIFLIELTKYLGFYPDISEIESSYFNLEDGKFYNQKIGKYCVDGENLIEFKHLLGIKFDSNKSVILKPRHKQEFLNMIILYFKLHLPGFYQPKSMLVLSQVFN